MGFCWGVGVALMSAGSAVGEAVDVSRVHGGGMMRLSSVKYSAVSEQIRANPFPLGLDLT